MPQSLQTTLSICDEIDALLADSCEGENTEKLRQIHTSLARLYGQGPYITRTADRLKERASIYFSARRHQKETGGAPAVMHEMRYSLLGRIRDEARERAKSQ